MPRKSAAARKYKTLLPPPVPSHCGAGRPSSARDEEEQLAKAVLASKACSMQADTYQVSLAKALELSKAVAEREAEEAEALKVAMAASLADAKEKGLGLGLQISAAISATSSAAGSYSGATYNCGQWGCSERREDTELVSKSPLCHGLSSGWGKAEAASVNDDACHLVAELAEAVEDQPPVRKLLKVTHRDDTRRLRLEWPANATARDMLTCIQTAVEESFGLPWGSAVPPEYFLKYRDDEGDLCTLVEQTLTDFLQAAQGNSLKIILEKRGNPSVQMNENKSEMGLTCRPLNGPRDEPEKTAEVGDLLDVKIVEPEEPEALQDFCIATPPASPRVHSASADSGVIEEDYEFMWSLVEADESVEVTHQMSDA